MKSTAVIRGSRADEWLIDIIVNEINLCRRYFIHGWTRTGEHPAFSTHLINLSFYLTEVDETIRENAERRLQKALLEEAARTRVPNKYPYVRFPKLVKRNGMYHVVSCTNL